MSEPEIPLQPNFPVGPGRVVMRVSGRGGRLSNGPASSRLARPDHTRLGEPF